MKTKLLNFAGVLLLLISTSTLYSQTNTFKLISDATEGTFTVESNSAQNTDANSNELFGITDEFRDSYSLDEQNEVMEVLFATTMIALGAGLGFGNDDTLWCLHAAYYMRLIMLTNAALYGSFGVVYDGLSGNFFKQNLIHLQLKFLMFHAITKYNQVHFLYGIMLAYGFGTRNFDNGFKYDLTQLTAALVLGFNIILTTQLSLMLQTNVLAHIRDTQKPESGPEFKDNNTLGFINKNNILAISLVWNLANRRR